MKTLLLMRHAKSAGGDPGTADFDRPLKTRGREAANSVGAHLRATGCFPDAIISSPALRARQTAEAVAAAPENGAFIAFEKCLYEASVEAIIRVARSVEGDPHILMLVGHNPSIHMAALKFSENHAGALRAGLLGSYPTAALAGFAFGEARWRDISWTAGTPTSFVTPKGLRQGNGGP